MKRILFLFLIYSTTARAEGDNSSLTATDYISMWKEEAIYQMAVHHIPASITLAQGMLESGNGNSRLAREGNNHFGIKCHEWDGKKIYEDDETKGECFRKYEDAHESFEDHSLFLKRKRYDELFRLDPDDYKGWAKGLNQCGYATNPNYPELLIDLIKRHGLEEFDKEGMKYIRDGKIPARPNRPAKPKEKKEREKEDNQDDFKEVNITANREVKLSQNQIKFILAKSGDTPNSISKDLDMMPWQILKYNDLKKTDALAEGQVIYLQPKRGRAAVDSYNVLPGETWWDISQKFGVKLKKLYKLNAASGNDLPQPGSVVKLR